MGDARKDLLERQKRELDYHDAQEAEDRKERDLRDGYRREGMQASRQLLHIMRGGKPSRDPNYEPPEREEKLPERGRARKQPPIIGVRG